MVNCSQIIKMSNRKSPEPWLNSDLKVEVCFNFTYKKFNGKPLSLRNPFCRRHQHEAVILNGRHHFRSV